MRLDPPLPKAVTKNSSGIHAPGDRPHAQVDDSNGGIPSPNRSSAVLGSNVAVPFSTSKATLWVSCIDAPDCAYVNWERLLNSITPQEKIKVQRYRTVKDQRHALTSILLQRALIRASFLVSDRDYQILRTSENKPYLSLHSSEHYASLRRATEPAFVNASSSSTSALNESQSELADRSQIDNEGRIKGDVWNFNVSHHGRYTCIAAHDECLVGVDLVLVELRDTWTEGIDAYILMFKDVFSATEIDEIMRPSAPCLRLRRFFLMWSLKEAIVKAIGRGLYYELTKIEFSIAFTEPAHTDDTPGHHPQQYQDCHSNAPCSNELFEHPRTSYNTPSHIFSPTRLVDPHVCFCRGTFCSRNSPKHSAARSPSTHVNDSRVVPNFSSNLSQTTLARPGSVCGTATVKLMGQPKPEWVFEFCNLDATHFISMALGPVSEAAESFRLAALSNSRSGFRKEGGSDPKDRLPAVTSGASSRVAFTDAARRSPDKVPINNVSSNHAVAPTIAVTSKTICFGRSTAPSPLATATTTRLTSNLGRTNGSTVAVTSMSTHATGTNSTNSSSLSSRGVGKTLATAVAFPDIARTGDATHRAKSSEAHETRTGPAMFALPSKAAAASKTPALFGSYSTPFASLPTVGKTSGNSVTMTPPLAVQAPSEHEVELTCPPNTPSTSIAMPQGSLEEEIYPGKSTKPHDDVAFVYCIEDCRSDTRTIGSQYSSFDTVDVGIDANDELDDDPCPDDGTIVAPDESSMDFSFDDDTNFQSPEQACKSSQDSYGNHDIDPAEAGCEGAYNRLHNQQQRESFGECNRMAVASGEGVETPDAPVFSSSNLSRNDHKASDDHNTSGAESATTAKPQVAIRYCEPPVGILRVMRSVSLTSILPPMYYKDY